MKNLISFFSSKHADKSQVYNRCSDITLDKFIDCIVDHNFNRLIKSGKPSKEAILKAWDDILSEYSELTATSGYKEMLSLTKEIGSLNCKITSVNLCLQVLSYQYSQECVDVLAKFGYRKKFDITNIENYIADLTSISNKLKTTILALNQRTQEYKTLIQKAGGETPSRDYYIKILVELSKYMGFRIKAEEISVSEYVSIMKKRDHEIEVQNRYAHKQGYGQKG